MINKLAKAQKSFIAKLILTLTALSFMSLFGITGYITSAGNNRTVISVDNVKVSQAEFSYEFQKELNAARNILDIDLNDEAADELRSNITNAVAQKMVKDAIIDRTAEKYNVLFRPTLIEQIIMNEPSFKDISGNFNKDLFRRVLSENNISETEYVKAVQRGLAEQILVGWPTLNIHVPNALIEAETKVDNKRRTFKYVIIRPSDVVVERQITPEEIEQYYEDFASEFIAPETRDLSVFYLSLEDIAKRINISDEEIRSYYDEHISDYETPEKRHVLQMMFEDEESAQKAYEALEQGEDFYTVAKDLASQSEEETDLGLASADELVFEISEDVFALNKDGYTKPIQVGDIWQIMKVTEIVAPTKQDYLKVSEEIKKELLGDNLYDYIYELTGQIEDKLGAGETLEAVAQSFKMPLLKVADFSDDGVAKKLPHKLKDVAKSADFIDTAFSYALNETSQALETDEGLVVIRVDKITESHSKDVDEVKPEIVEMWANNERTALAQETLNDLMHDLENGDDFARSARRYGLHVYKSQPITRNESFADLNYADVKELFMQDLFAPYQTSVADNYVVVIPTEDFQNGAPVDEAEKNMVLFKARQGLVRDLQKAMLDAYAKDYKIKVKYKLMGFVD